MDERILRDTTEMMLGGLAEELSTGVHTTAVPPGFIETVSPDVWLVAADAFGYDNREQWPALMRALLAGIDMFKKELSLAMLRADDTKAPTLETLAKVGDLAEILENSGIPGDKEIAADLRKGIAQSARDAE